MSIKPASTSPHQVERFREMARQISADDSDDALDRAMGRLDLKVKPKRTPPMPPASKSDE